MRMHTMATAIVALMATPVLAQGVITTGPFSVGIGPNGELFDVASYIGFIRHGDSYDPLAPGTPRDSWGITTSGGSAFGDHQYFGALNIASVVFTKAWLGASQTALISTTFGVGIRMDYIFAAPNVLKVHHTVFNLNGAPFTEEFLFQRNWDLDVDPTAFNENTVGAFFPIPVVDDSYWGFENPDPSVPYALSCGSACNELGDLGGGIKIARSAGRNSFTYCYAINDEGQSLDGLVGQMRSLGCAHIIGTQSSENGLWSNLGFNSGAISLVVPEPGTWAMLIAGFGLVGWAARRRSTAITA